MSRRIITGIDIGTATVRVVVSEHDQDEGFPVVIGMGSADSKGLRHGYIMSTMEATRSIEKALREASQASGARIEEVYLSVGGTGLEANMAHGAIIIPRADTEIMESDVERVLRVAEENLQSPANKKILHSIPVEFLIDGKPVLGRPAGMRGLKLEVRLLVITCLAQHLEDMIAAVEDAGVIVADVMASPIAASLVTLTKAQKMAGCVLANIGAETLSIVVYEDGIPISLEVFPVGSTNITNDIALGLKIPLEEAERIKLGRTTAPIQKKKYTDIISGRLEDMFNLVNAHLKKIGKQELLPAGIILTGGGTSIETIEDYARAAMKLPARIPSPDFIVDPSTNMPIKDTSWFVAYGLTVFGASSAPGGMHRMNSGWSEIKRTFSNFFKQLLP